MKVSVMIKTTYFDPFLDEANERNSNCLIVFTDGEAPAPTNKTKCPILWVHSSRSKINTELPGFKIQIPA